MKQRARPTNRIVKANITIRVNLYNTLSQAPFHLENDEFRHVSRGTRGLENRLEAEGLGDGCAVVYGDGRVHGGELATTGACLRALRKFVTDDDYCSHGVAGVKGGAEGKAVGEAWGGGYEGGHRVDLVEMSSSVRLADGDDGGGEGSPWKKAAWWMRYEIVYLLSVVWVGFLFKKRRWELRR